MFYVYVLRSLKTGKRYVGQTHDLSVRLAQHNEGFSPYTSGRGPWELVYNECYETRSEAIRREKFLKSGKGRKFLDVLLGKK
jgi:putative endonuclease